MQVQEIFNSVHLEKMAQNYLITLVTLIDED